MLRRTTYPRPKGSAQFDSQGALRDAAENGSATVPVWDRRRLPTIIFRAIDSLLHDVTFRGRGSKKCHDFFDTVPWSGARSYVLRHLARELIRQEDPNCQAPDPNKGIDELAALTNSYRAKLLPMKVQNIVAFSQLMRKQVVSKGLRLALSQRNDDDAFLLLHLIDAGAKSHVDAVNAVLQRHGLPPAPLARTGLGVERFGFPKVAAAHGEKVTVAMTTRNNMATLEQAIWSVLNQSWRNLELIIVDDASTDVTAKILKQFEAADRRVRVLQNALSIGTYCSKNRALEAATGKYFTCHDSDDWSHPLKIERQVQALKSEANDRLVANLGDWLRMDDDGFLYLWGPGMFCRNYSSLLFSTKHVRESIGFYDSVRIGADSELVARIRKTFGYNTVRETREVASVARYASTSLTGHSKFRLGFRCASPARESYRKSHQKWHAVSQCLYLPREQSVRKFSAPDEIIVSANSVRLATRNARDKI